MPAVAEIVGGQRAGTRTALPSAVWRAKGAGFGRGTGQAQGLPLPSFEWSAMAPLLAER